MSRILIVDDKEENLYYLQALLTGHGYTVDTARHGAEALVKARQGPPGMVVSDLLMPVMDGFTLLRYWKADLQLKQIPFIVYTATYTEAEDERLALNLGADAFILKPAEPEDFLSRIREVQTRATQPGRASPQQPIPEEKELLKVYSETLIRKLEEKTLQLEETNRALQQDIAERKRAEENLRESEERFRATFEQVAVGIAHLDVDGTILRVNDKLCEITGYSRPELLRLTFLDVTVPEDRADGDQARRAMLAGTHTVYAGEKRYQRKDGGLVWVNVVSTLLRDQAGAPKYFISVITDVTERKKLEQQFLRAQRMESIGTLAGGIAHDLNNVLAPIMMSLELLRTKVQDEEAASTLETLRTCSQRGADLIQQVLSFGRGLEGQRVLINPAHVLREIHKIVRDTFPKAIEFRLALSRDLWCVTGDPTQLHQVFLNLCVNARDAMPDGGSLTMTTGNVELDEVFTSTNPEARPGPYVLTEVEDTGPGIPPDIRDRIFEPFFTTKEVGKGTGLGLSTTLTIVKSHGGFITLESEPGRGTKFRIYLPAITNAVPADSTSEPAGLLRGNGELILVVDDEAGLRHVAQKTLERFGYRALLACHGAEAVSLYALHRAQIAAVITDMAMPVMDGSNLVIALKSLNPDVKIIVSTGLASEGNMQKAVDAGVMHFIPKPYTAQALLQELHRLLHDQISQTPPVPSAKR